MLLICLFLILRQLFRCDFMHLKHGIDFCRALIHAWNRPVHYPNHKCWPYSRREGFVVYIQVCVINSLRKSIPRLKSWPYTHITSRQTLLNLPGQSGHLACISDSVFYTGRRQLLYPEQGRIQTPLTANLCTAWHVHLHNTQACPARNEHLALSIWNLCVWTYINLKRENMNVNGKPY